MIDVIIPAYNSHATILRTLSSIAMQLNKEELVVTIVNDGGKDYQDIINIFKSILNIKEIKYETNRGPGYARQYGIDNTSAEYIVFIDADDTFLGAGALELMTLILKDSEAEFLISPFIQYGTSSGAQEKKEANFTWVFGHLYKRKFLVENNIRFTSTRSNEDVGFNLACSLTARNQKGDAGIVVLNVPTYEWHYNPNSITLKKDSAYFKGTSIPGYIYNTYMAYETVTKKINIPIRDIAYDILQSAFGIYTYYNLALISNIDLRILEIIENLSRQFYCYYYKETIKYISEEERNYIFKRHIQDLNSPVLENELKIEFNDFVKSMYSKPSEENNYEQIEKEIQTIAENSI